MPRYYFHVEFGEYSPDLEGTEFATPADAQGSAGRLVAEMMVDQVRFWRVPGLTVTVTDDWGVVLWKIDVTTFASPAAAVGDP